MMLNAWEYDDVGWVPIRELAAFARAEPCIPPMVEVVEAGILAGL